MAGKILKTAQRALKKRGLLLVEANDPVREFHSFHYLRHNARRLEHLASLGIPVAGMSVLEVGAGIGDHSHYYIDRGCAITITEARKENLDVLRSRYPKADVRALDMEKTDESIPTCDVVHCYGLLYHLSNPAEALRFLARHTKQLLFLETCVSFGDDEAVNLLSEPQANPTQAFSGTGCRPTSPWILARLKELFECVYVPVTQPNHPEFPVDWSNPAAHGVSLQRAAFVASRSRLDNPSLATSLPVTQIRHA